MEWTGGLCALEGEGTWSSSMVSRIGKLPRSATHWARLTK